MFFEFCSDFFHGRFVCTVVAEEDVEVFGFDFALEDGLGGGAVALGIGGAVHLLDGR